MIATDLDGTLLRGDKSLPKGFGELARLLLERGIIFVAASGRQYANVYNTLLPYAENFYIISDNGSINGKGREITSSFLMPPEKVDEVLAGIEGVSGALPLICTAECGYYTDDDPDFIREMQKYYVKVQNVGDGTAPIAALYQGKAGGYYRESGEQDSRILPRQGGGNKREIAEHRGA